MRTAITACSLALLAGSAMGQTTRTILETDASGSRVLSQHTRVFVSNEARPGIAEDLLWTYFDVASIPNSAAIGAGGDEAWVGHSLNDQRISKFTVASGNTPDLMYSLLAEAPANMGVAAASNGALGAVISQSSSGVVTARGFSAAGGSTPLWTYTFGTGYNEVRNRSIAINADGSRVAVCAYDGADTLLVILDGDGNELNSTTVAGFALSLDMDDSGNRVVVTAGAIARLYDTNTMTQEYALSVSGAGGWARISRDGSAIADGGFNVRAAREIEGVWQVAYSGTGTTDWFGAVSLSADGQTLFAVSHDYASGYLINDHRIVDLNTSTVIASSGFTGSGSFQNSVVSSEVNADGTVFVAATWGDQANTQPEIRVYDRGLNMIDSLDTDGSPFAMDLSQDGSRIVVSTKSVHANTFGNGGATQVYDLDVAPPCLADVNHDGSVTPADFSAWVAAFNTMAPECDQNGDGSCTPADFSAWVANFNAGC
ncbi:MAG: hypothetical protein KDA31_11690 [Phycisphaerales bacterium]|nr:hypothetical protein [Phycisphaerales bacterium]MCB9835775.1 hypothetical protein [Phycisphaera sp.]